MDATLGAAIEASATGFWSAPNRQRSPSSSGWMAPEIEGSTARPTLLMNTVLQSIGWMGQSCGIPTSTNGEQAWQLSSHLSAGSW